MTSATKFYTVSYEWIETSFADRVERICKEWEHTPLMRGQSRKGVGTSCWGFVMGALDDLSSVVWERPKLRFGSRRKNRAAMRAFLSRYPGGFRRVYGSQLEPGDVVRTGLFDGDQHLYLAGGVQSHLYHVAKNGVVRTGCGFYEPVIAVHRMKDRSKWN